MTHARVQHPRFGVVALLAALVFSACSQAPAPRTLTPAESAMVAQIDRSLAKATRYMIAAQSPDGAWRSATYGFMKDGPSLTPHIATCLYFVPASIPDESGRPAPTGARASFSRGMDYLVQRVGQDGTILPNPALIYPVYTAAEASRMIPKAGTSEREVRAGSAWLAVLRSHQMNEALGWQKSDLEYGGWGFATEPPHKPAAGQQRGPWDWSNLTATLYGIAALRSAKIPASDPSFAQALTFIERCQNFSEDAGHADPDFDDGGFFFTPANDLQNKAGSATDRFGAKRFRSYGSMTVDGLRGLLACGLSPDHPRVRAARGWLERYYSPDHNPGAFVPANEDLRDATYYYYTWSCAHAFLHLNVRHFDSPRGRIDWPFTLAQTLLARQRPDGSWTNSYTDAREDDPLVSTPFATAALAICRQFLTAPEDPTCAPTETPPLGN